MKTATSVEVSTIGLTEYAQEAMGDIVYVELPKVDEVFKAHAAFGSVELLKAVSELFTQLSGWE